jgi:hypothetical protein
MAFFFIRLPDDVRRAQATKTAAPQRHLGRRAFVLHALPLEQRGWEQHGCKWRPSRVSLCHPWWDTQHHEAAEAIMPRPPSHCSPTPPRMQRLPAPYSSSKATGTGALVAEGRTHAHHVFTEIPSRSLSALTMNWLLCCFFIISPTYIRGYV